MTKTQVERLARLEEVFVGIREDIAKVEGHLALINGSVAENSKFRVQQQVVYWVIGVAWASIFIPLVTLAVVALD